MSLRFETFLHLVAVRLKDAREKAGLTEQALADIMKVTQPQISRIESGTLNITMQTIWKYSEALNSNVGIELTPIRRLPKKK